DLPMTPLCREAVEDLIRSYFESPFTAEADIRSELSHMDETKTLAHGDLGKNETANVPKEN
ncbi:MAG: hypothetical protein KDA84_26975, partial [Planctomycetaceae bacterium]|nr:hypothetical protein [Planctomycetaceae bacterium]